MILLRMSVVFLPLIGSSAVLLTKQLPAAELYRGPYLQLATPTSVTVVWRTVGSTTPMLRFGLSPDDLDREVVRERITLRLSADVAAHTPGDFQQTLVLYDEPSGLRDGDEVSSERRDPSTRPGTHQYEATAQGLKPHTKYYYAVYDGKQLLAGADEDHFFTTSPQPTDATDVRIWVVGDSGTGGRDQRQVHEAMRQYATQSQRLPDLFLHVGDMAYADGTDSEFQRNFFDVYQPTLRHTVCWPAMGNHEGHTSRGISQFGPYYDAYVLPTEGEAGGLPSGTEAYYSFDVAGVHCVCLDSHDLDRTPKGAMARWLEADLDETQAKWLIAFWHHPPYTKGSHDSDNELQLREMRTFIMPILEAGGVDVVLAGHSHIYERSMLIDGAYATPTMAQGVILDDGDGHPDGDGPYRKSDGLEPHNGTVAIVAGHGGAGLSRRGTMPIMRQIIVEHGSLVVDIQGDRLTGRMINKHGKERDTFQIHKQGNVKHSPIAKPWQPKHDPNLLTSQRVSFPADQVGAVPLKWRVVQGSPAGLTVKKNTDAEYNSFQVTAEEHTRVTTYEGFEGRVGRFGGYIKINNESESHAGLVFAWQDADNHACFLWDPENSKAIVSQVSNGQRKVVSEKKLEADFGKPLEVVLEFEQKIVEVHVGDEIEYAVHFEDTLPKGRVGLIAGKGARLDCYYLTIERAR